MLHVDNSTVHSNASCVIKNKNIIEKRNRHLMKGRESGKETDMRSRQGTPAVMCAGCHK